MEYMTTQLASSSAQNKRLKRIASSTSSSPPLPLWKYEVFLSFYGDDTRKGFTDHLYSALKRKGILAFRDDEKLPRGKYVAEELLKAIQESLYAVVVISPHYAFSTFCLIELAEIIECMRYKRLIVFPVFYHVDPSDVRKHRGTFAEAFDKHDKDPTVDAKKKRTWRDALTIVSTIAGWPLKDGHEATVVEEITRRIFSELIQRFSINYRELVGIEARVEKMMELLGIGSDEQDVRFIGIHGMGGVGKTTLAKVIFDRVSYHFEASSFIGCIREEAKKQGLGSLRKQLLSEIMEEEMGRFNAHAGLNVIENRLRGKQVLIVLDDVDGSEQIEALAGSQEWFGPGSRIVLTSKDNQLLKTHGVKDIYSYKVQEMGGEEALQLFSLSAFKDPHPKENYKDLCEGFVSYAQGLPLALKVVGGFLFEKPTRVWRSALKCFEENPPRQVFEVLKVGFDGLDDDKQQNLFLDIACFFNGETLDSLQDILESFGYHPLYNIEVLRDRSLITISSDKVIKMHDLLQEMGRKIVCHQKKPGMRTRLWRFEDILHVLKTDSVSGLF